MPQDARQIVLQPLDVPAICDYLIRRFPGDQPGQLAPRWDSVRAALQAPTAAGQGPSLAGILSSPWQLFLAATAYQDDTSDPGELIRLPADDLGEYLLGQLIPAVTRRTAGPGRDHYQPDQVRAWLSTLAGHLDQTSNDLELRWSPTDLRLEQLWPIAGKRTVRRLSTLVNLLLLGALSALPGLVWVHANERWYPDTSSAWFGLFAIIFGLVYLARYLTSSSAPTLHRLNLRLISFVSPRQLAGTLASGLAFGLVVGLVVGLAGRLWIGLVVGLAVGLAFGLVVGLAVGLSGSFSLAAQPSTVMRQNITYTLAFGLAVGLPGGLAFELTPGRAGGLAFGLTGGLAFVLAGAQTQGLAVWIRYLIGCWRARREGMLPRRVSRFLDWGYDANLLRMSGTAAQFRHREFQDWLKRHSDCTP